MAQIIQHSTEKEQGGGLIKSDFKTYKKLRSDLASHLKNWWMCKQTSLGVQMIENVVIWFLKAVVR